MAKLHWADQVASELISANPDKARFVLASGITPSGVVHVGNFREVITVDLVARCLRRRGKEVRFIFSWDDFDVFRKVPKDLPEGENFEQHLRKSVSVVPDPYGQSDSYAGHFVERFEAELSRVGIAPEFIRQSRQYAAGCYADGISRALQQREVIREALNRHRSSPLDDAWLPLAGFCAQCERDTLTFSAPPTAAPPQDITYRCDSCGHEDTVSLQQGGTLKLPWRIDWPMRWAYEGVDFEPGGKDHSTAGGSYDTGKEIAKRVYGAKAPRYIGYEFVRAKGQGGKLSSSAGGVITVTDCLEIYQPEILRWQFTRIVPRSTLQISFDDDVIQTYEEFDRALAKARKVASDDPGPLGVARRGIELACVGGELDLLASSYVLPPFRGITTLVQAYDGDLERSFNRLAGGVRSDAEATWLRTRIECAWHWVQQHAPEDFRFLLRREPVQAEVSGPPRDALELLVSSLRKHGTSEQELIATLKSIAALQDLDIQEFFRLAYELLIGKSKGPKLSTLLASLEPERALALLEPTLSR